MASLSYAMKDGMVPVLGMFSSFDKLRELDQWPAGTCDPKEGDIGTVYHDKSITASFSNISWGELGTTTQKKVAEEENARFML